jgi:hypothetical protein
MSSNHLNVQRAGLAIIAIGLIVGAAAYFTAGTDDSTDDISQQREMQQVARLGGTATVQTVKFNLWLSSLWHGQRLGVTLAVLGLLVGGACWKVGELMGEEDLPD